jgi:hypothetical protein
VDTHVVERTEAPHAGAARQDPAEYGAEKRQAGVTWPPTQDEWRWVADAEEVDLPTRPVEKGDGAWKVLIRALAWSSARFCG